MGSDRMTSNEAPSGRAAGGVTSDGMEGPGEDVTKPVKWDGSAGHLEGMFDAVSWASREYGFCPRYDERRDRYVRAIMAEFAALTERASQEPERMSNPDLHALAERWEAASKVPVNQSPYVNGERTAMGRCAAELRAALAGGTREAERLCARCFIAPTMRSVPLCEVCEPKMLDEWGPPSTTEEPR